MSYRCPLDRLHADLRLAEYIAVRHFQNKGGCLMNWQFPQQIESGFFGVFILVVSAVRWPICMSRKPFVSRMLHCWSWSVLLFGNRDAFLRVGVWRYMHTSLEEPTTTYKARSHNLWLTELAMELATRTRRRGTQWHRSWLEEKVHKTSRISLAAELKETATVWLCSKPRVLLVLRRKKYFCN